MVDQRAADLGAYPAGAVATAPLPMPLTSLIGRDADIERLVVLLDRGDVRLVTLIGPGGVGKTRLAIAVGARLASDFADGVGFVDLIGLNDPAGVPGLVTRSLGYRYQANGNPVGQLTDALRSRHRLIITDNFEHLLGESPGWLSQLLHACPLVNIIVTSRVPLGIDGEQRYHVAPLPVTQGATEPGAVRLFIERVRSRDLDFEPDDRVEREVAEICRRLDGLPLAIELAAARTQVLSVREILERLDESMALLKSDRRDGPERHQSLHRAIAWSYELLSPGARRLLRQLAVFERGAPLDAVEAVAATGSPAYPEMLSLVKELVDHSLLRPRRGQSGLTRYEMLVTVREFALDHLAVLGEEESARDAHADWVCRFAEDLFRDSAVGRYHPYLDRVEEEVWNLEAGSAWLLRRDRVEDVVDIDGKTAVFRRLRGLVPDHADLFERLLRHPRLAVPGAARAKALLRLGESLLRVGEHRRAREVLEEARRLFEELDEPYWQTECAMYLGFAYRSLGDLSRARSAMEDAYAARRQSGLEAYAAGALLNLGVISMLEGDLGAAERLEMEGRGMSLAVGEEWLVAYADLWLGHIAMERGQNERAEALLVESRRAFEALGNVLDIPKVELALARLAMRRGDREAAQASLEAALAAARTIGEAEYIAQAQAQAELGRLDVERREFAAAAGHIREALGLFRSMEHPSGTVDVLRVVAGLADAARTPKDAAVLRSAASRLVTHPGAGDGIDDAAHRDVWAAVDAAVTAADTLLVELERARVAGRAKSWGLSEREREVLRPLTDGFTNREIADALFVSERTVATHIEHIMTKLNVRSRTAAVAFAIRNGLA